MVTVRNAVYDQIYCGDYALTEFSEKEKESFIVYGFARHRDDKKVIDEPLALLAALHWANRSTEFSLFKWACRDIANHSQHKNGFEVYLTYYLRKVFEETPELDAVFTFRSDFASRRDLAWQHEIVELVSVTDMENEPQICVTTLSSGPASNVGFKAESDAEVLEWISTNRDRFTFCFPTPSFGPDLLFFVRSTRSKSLLLVVVQAKRYEVVPKATLIHGVCTVTPSWFWKNKDTKVCSFYRLFASASVDLSFLRVQHATAATAPFIGKGIGDCAAELDKVLKKILPGLTAGDADYPVLRVFASWPGEPNLERTLEWKEERKGGEQKGGKRNMSMDNTVDPDHHPLATLDLAIFNEVGKKLDQDWFRGVEEKVLVPSKRAP